MGKTQSKRSVDITTEGKKVPEEEVTGKLEKIDDPDQKQLNGDGAPQESAEVVEKKDADESENDKDLTTEKSVEAGQGDGDAAEQKNTATAGAADSPKTDDTCAGGCNDTENASSNAGGTEEISPLSDENSKKPKKEKVKKKWSFRSISFGKKDKQKPAKSDEGAADNPNAVTLNGDSEPTAEKVEGTTESLKKEENGEKAEIDEKPIENGENGNASEQDMNGQKTPASTPTEEKSNEVVSKEITTKTIATAESNIEATANQINQTEKQTESAEINTATSAVADTISNGEAAKNNGNGAEATSPVEEIDMESLAKDKIASAVVEPSAEAATVAEKIKSIPNVLNDGCEIVASHQNGTTACDEEITEPKAQIEEIANVKDMKENAAVEITTQDLPVTCE